MDRRRLIVGGGAVAVSTTLAALAGRGILPAAASTVDPESTATAEHARRVLDLVNADLGLVNPDGLQGEFVQGCSAYLASPPPRDTEPTGTPSMEAWTRQRMVDLCGTDSFVEAVTEVPQTRTLLAFGLVACSQHQEGESPQVYQGMPVPAVLEALEPDFFPVLLDQVDARSSGTPAFADALQAGSAHLDLLVDTLPEIEPAALRVRRPTDLELAALMIVVLGNLALLCTGAYG